MHKLLNFHWLIAFIKINCFFPGLKECGRDWEAIARRVVTKTGAQCKNFYFNYKKKMRLEDLIAEHEKTKVIILVFCYT